MSVRFDSTTERLTRTADLPTGSWTLCGWFRQLADNDIYNVAMTCVGASNVASIQTISNGSPTWTLHDTEFFPTQGNTGTDWFFAALVNTSGVGVVGKILRFPTDVALDTTASITATGALSEVVIGNYRASDPNYFLNGDAAYVRLWDAALTDDELMWEAFSRLPVRYANLNFAWREVDAASVTDLGANVRDPTINGTLALADDPSVTDILHPTPRRILSAGGGGGSAEPLAAMPYPRLVFID